MGHGRCTAVVLLYCAVVSVFLASLVLAGDDGLSTASNMPLFEQIIVQPFTVSVISGRYGVFNATLALRASPIFPEHIHGELIPIGEQRRGSAEQLSLEHFNYPRPMEGEMPTPGMVDAHPSLLRIDVQLRFSGSTSGTVTAWALPAVVGVLERGLSEVEETDAAPTAQASFLFVSESKSMSPSTLSDVPSMARTATGIVELEGGRSGSFTFRFFSEHEFSLNLQLRTEDNTTDRSWVYGYVPPDNTLLSRPDRSQKAWWQNRGIWVFAITTFIMRAVMAYFETRRAANLRRKRTAAAAMEKKKIK
ncbi:hypothetical protein C3747_89g166 [Trypanosoma cruzi]|uniref:Transmembrane protein n=2 Tax=Trypanosoma cruzi TaxID=5693 RepID=Q4CXL9_TRYCC|nr:hypothetical protein, conserved [Trypanosoma cruzi]EAN85015.1 hypothetical protein, conserved [Trypanosoma cruzi]PWV08481.1 hypothetical protein C3747_89g166 [Trypanosoma cruzi]RNC49409.1 hypothetical protein TcCL_NonESM00636 [Trypanosoma cruzi]|eukprot:XP_806866.1 hypothetical protein [Trypanosoma cruzi strain CL Brener]